MPGRLYSLGVAALRYGTRLAAVFHPKARARDRGARATLRTLAPTPPGRDAYWMQCASVGEFEQGRPVWERLRACAPGARFVLTFYSPSGMDFYGGRDDLGEVVYLPWDSPGAAAAFVGRLSPKLALFVKYEWWLHFHAELRRGGTPTVVFSVAFRPGQPFFRRRHLLHEDYREALSGVTEVFVQSAASARLLRAHDYPTPATVAGDTRLDRVLAIADDPGRDERIEAWLARGSGPVLVAGSTWPPDEEGLAELLRTRDDYRIIVATHEVSAGAVGRVTRRLAAGHPVGYAALAGDPASGGSAGASRVLVLDVKGVLARAYRYGDLAYVGGGFGAGVHNVLEAAVYGKPVAFGPRHARFDEAVDLAAAGVAVPLRRPRDLVTFAAAFDDPTARARVREAAAAYVRDGRGASDVITGALAARDLI